MVGHFTYVLYNLGSYPLVDLTNVLFARLPVLVFFALSGYVLALPFWGDDQPAIPAFLIKRICRVYLPYLATVIAVLMLFSRPSISIIAGMFAMSGRAETLLHDPPWWSLVVEMRFSLIFPMLIAAARFRSGIVAAILATIVSVAIFASHLHVTDFRMVTIASTLYYSALFIGGILMARYREPVLAFAARRLSILWVVLIGFVWLGSKYDPALFIAALALVVLVQATPRVSHILSGSRCQWLGRISYSIYLWQAIVLFATWDRYGGPALPILVFIPGTLLVAELSQRFIESPSIRLGAALAHVVGQRAKNDERRLRPIPIP
jgi:peptidoglycan/LPS O-acetylase OafA/YrhL